MFSDNEEIEGWQELGIDFENSSITVEERQMLINNLKRETKARIQKLRQQAEKLAKEIMASCEQEINSIPIEIRRLPLDEFINLYHADPAEYFRKQKTAHNAQITPVIKSTSKRTLNSRYLIKKTGEQSESGGLLKKRTERDIIRPIVSKKELIENKIVKSKNSYDNEVSRLRYPEPGERIISLRGTPIFNPFPISKNESKDNPFIMGGGGLCKTTKSLVIPLEDGKIIESPSQIQEMTTEKKKEVKNKIKLYRKELNKFSSILDK
ncbi:unnamed protein product [Rhizophagus irregularis]|uniref:Borealin N-terminal domain-containing protein n=3 Tax=Rhizophagus irregularis TaxID=588596 RepID=A0A915ZSB4_9GLOM|nr:hypothetical protein RirG_214030 [Rhizophagus irregularis DAOM 197198w]GBC53671.1 hypothetical protein GLOIN_2v1671527 [Rhizophagus irregularis DAOM 181602=DAOM 197198]CAB4485039.1 unnamed protein product [Rhizophagus irregularis]CAB5196222.1 unnamed protein product [Rhizophagus irregularis]CAB5385199.1 unnamed protein product [Rhizophagus irregularis]